MSLDQRTARVVSLLRTIIGTGTHCAVSSAALRCGVGAWRVTETAAKFSCEMRVVVKAARVGNRTDGFPCVQQFAAIEKACGVVQTKRINEFAAGKSALRKELLEVAQGDPGFRCRLGRAEIRIGKAVFDEAADTNKQLVRMV